MSAKKNGLGRGLNALLNSHLTAKQIDVEPELIDVQRSDQRLTTLPINALQPGRYQPRSQINETALAELSQSIKSQGIIQPIVVRPINQEAKSKYEIIAGERRWRAAQLADFSEVPVIIKSIPDEVALAMALIENIQREDLNPIEEARALQRLIDEFELTHQQLAEMLGKSRATISNLLRLLKLPSTILLFIEEGQLEVGHAKVFLTLPVEQQTQLAQQIIARQLTVRETELLVQQLTNLAAPRTMPVKKKEEQVLLRGYTKELSQHLGTKVKFQHESSGKGKLIIHYQDLDALSKILSQLALKA